MRSKPPSAREIAYIGKKLRLHLPQVYVDTMARYPFPLDSELAEVVLYAEPSIILQENEDLRENGFFGCAWPKEYFVIGGVGNGDLSFLNTAQTEPVVMFAEHERTTPESLAIKECAGHLLLPEWVGMVKEGWQQFGRNKNVS
jgi:hypothetical protein